MRDADFLPVSPRDLIRLWMQDEIAVVCRRPPDLEDHPDLALRVRGALGRVLARQGPPVAHRFDPFDRPSAFKILFEESDDGRGRPFALDADVLAESVLVRLRLFGAAGFWIDQVREALLEALAGGIAFRLGGRQHVPLEPLECAQRRTGLTDPPERCGEAVLVFRTPIVVRAGHRLSGSPRAVLWSAVTRLRGLAPWQGVRLAVDEAALEADLAAAPALDDVTTVSLRRHSQRQGDVAIPVTGLLGRQRLWAPGAILPFLAAGADTHIGSHAALGFGRYDLSLYP